MFLKNISSHTHAFCSFNALRSFCNKLVCSFFENWFFPKFRSIEILFRSIKIAFKNFGQPLSVSIDAWLMLVPSKHFRSIENRINSFSNLIFTCPNLLFKKFSKLSLSVRLGQGFNQTFLLFSSILFARVFSRMANKTFIPFQGFGKVLCKSYLMLDNLIEWIENMKFWENWFQNLCFWKTFHLMLMHFILSMHWGVSAINWFVLFSKIFFFQNFDRSNFFCDQSNLGLKTLVNLYLFRSMLDWNWFHRSIFDRSYLIIDQSKIV